MSGLIDVCVVDYDTLGLARKCIASLDSPLFNSVELIDARRRKTSYSRACNESLKRGDAPYVLALNADCEMLEPPDVVIEIFESDPSIAVIGPRQYRTADMRITHAGILGTNTTPQHRFWLHPYHDWASQCAERALDCVTVSGSVYFVRRSVWEELGGFLETDHFYDETWFSYLARHRRYRVVYTGQNTWVHEFNQTPNTEQWRVERMLESREIFRAACRREGIACN